MNYVEECLVRRAALAEWKLERIERYEQAVIQNQMESILDSDPEPSEDLDARVWQNTDPAGALRIFVELFAIGDDIHLEMGTVTASLEVIRWVIGNDILMDGADVQGSAKLLFDDRLGYRSGALRRLVETAAARTGDSGQQLAEKCIVVLQVAALGEGMRLKRHAVQKLRKAREAILPDEETQKNNERHRAHYERSRVRAFADFEVLQRARNKSLPPPLRIHLEET